MKIIKLLLLLFPTVIWAQTKILGVVFANNQTQEQLTVTNLHTQHSAITNRLGKFVIQAALNDSLQFKHNDFLTRTITLNYKQIQAQELTLELTPKVTELDEIIVDATQKIDAVSLGILEKPAKQYSKTERRLQTAGDFKTTDLLMLFSGAFPLDPVINAISGRTKMLKKTLSYEKQNALYEKLKEHYDLYVEEVLEVTDVSIRNAFFNYLTEIEDIENLVFTKNKEQNKFYIYTFYKNQYLKI